MWRPETHIFHLPSGEMALMLQQVLYLLGLPIVGEAVGVVDVPDTRRAGLLDRFAEVMVPPDHQRPLPKNCWIHISVLLNKY
jgi:hypothetical protein